MFLELAHWRRMEREAERHRPMLTMFYNANRGKSPSKKMEQLWPLSIDNLYKESRSDYEERMQEWIENLPKAMKKK